MALGGEREFRHLDTTKGPPSRFEVRPEGAARLARDLLGRFTSLQSAVPKAFERAAADLQEEEAEQLLKGLRRPQGALQGRPEQFLHKALLSEENRKVTLDSFTVNIPEFLNSPASRVNLYWRGLEEGTDKHVNDVIYGYFLGAGLGTRYAPSKDRFGLDARLIAAGSGKDFQHVFKDNISGKAITHGQFLQRIQQRTQGRAVPSGGKQLHIIRIKNEIKPVHFIQKGIAAWKQRSSLDRELLTAFQQVGLRVLKRPGPRRP